jgi:putative (di)nucleoside polyphosphate hydrolase
MRQEQVIPDEYFRAGAGAVLLNGEGQVLALERSDVPGAWQFPQGGLQPGEDPLDAALREVQEEVGITSDELRLIRPLPEPLVYVLPPQYRSPKTGMGQVQWWFLFRYGDGTRGLHLPLNGEFRNWAWKSIDDVIDGAASFRRPIYERLRDFLREVSEG